MRIYLPSTAPVLRLVGPLLLALSLSACNLLIPENPSAARYNKVLGAPRAPELNPGNASGGERRSQAPLRGPETAQAPQAAFPPVSPETEMRAQEIVAADVPPPPGAAPLRQMPNENQAPPMQMAGNYPDLTTVPPTPPMGAESDAARLARVRAQLEADRAEAAGAKARLATDAAAEPSLLNEPMPAPITPAPMPPQSYNTPPNAGYIAQLPPPPPPMNQSAGTAWDRSASPIAPPVVASAAPAMEPIVLRPPTAAASAPAAPNFGYSAPVQASNMAPAMQGGFNPMAGGDPIVLRAPTSYAGGTNYLPESRYTARRTN